MTKAAIFDLDGTLLDSMGVWDQVDIDFLGKRGIEVPPDYMIKVSSMQFQQIAEYTIARFGLKDTPEELMQEWDDMARMASAKSVGMKVWAMHDDSSDADWPEICDIADGVLFDFHDAPRPL